MNDRVAYGKLEVLAGVWIQTNNITIFYRLVFAYLIMETHGSGSTTVQSISNFEGTVSDDGLSQQLGFLFEFL